MFKTFLLVLKGQVHDKGINSNCQHSVKMSAANWQTNFVAEDLNAQYQNSSLDMPMNEATYLNYLANWPQYCDSFLRNRLTTKSQLIIGVWPLETCLNTFGAAELSLNHPSINLWLSLLLKHEQIQTKDWHINLSQTSLWFSKSQVGWSHTAQSQTRITIK